MDAPVVVAIISAAAGLVASALTFFLTKKKERDAEWRKLKLDRYGALLMAASDLAADKRDGRSFARAANDANLVASPEVLTTLRAFVECVSGSAMTVDTQDQLFTALMHAIRADLGVSSAKGSESLRLKLLVGGKADAIPSVRAGAKESRRT